MCVRDWYPLPRLTVPWEMPLSLCASVSLAYGDLIPSLPRVVGTGGERDQGQQLQVWVRDQHIAEPF